MIPYEEALANAVSIAYKYNCITGAYLNIVANTISYIYGINETTVKSELNKMIKKDKRENYKL